jgi:hypothetical protein
MATEQAFGPVDGSIPAHKWSVQSQQWRKTGWGGKISGSVTLNVLHQKMGADGKWYFEYVELILDTSNAALLTEQLEIARNHALTEDEEYVD